MQSVKAKSIGGVLLSLAVIAAASAVCAEDVDPNPPPLVLGQSLHRWSFERDAGGWTAAHDCRVSVADGTMQIVSTGEDPYLVVKLSPPVPGPMLVRLKVRSSTAGTGQFFWASDRQPHWGEPQSGHFEMNHDGQWHEYEVMLDVRGLLTQLRLDPGSGPGKAEVASIELQAASVHPVSIEHMETTSQQLALVLRNRGEKPLAATVAGQTMRIAGGQTAKAVQRISGDAAFQSMGVRVEVQGLPPLRRTVIVHRPEGKCNWVTASTGGLTLRVASDGSGAEIRRDGKLAAVIAPLVLADGAIARLKVTRQQNSSVELEGEGIHVGLTLSAHELAVSIQSKRTIEGPVVRAVGSLQQGLFAGVEYLGRGEKSSSKLDIETADHLRFAPDPLKVTMPLMTCVTDRAAVSTLWRDMSLQPTFASPDFVDGLPGEHRMSLRGKGISAVIRVDGGDVEDAILWAVRKTGLPPLPRTPRDSRAQFDLALAALNGPIRGEGGWGHCAEPHFGRQPFADLASTIWRITGRVPSLERLVPGGSHVRNEAVYFVTGRAGEWLEMHRREIKGIIAAQQADGSFRYRGRYQQGHYEDTASGHCALYAMRLLEFAHLTGDRAALEAGLKTLEYMKRFRVPRGAQTWELSLHTPDVLASAYLVWAYVLGYEVSGKTEYLELARKWALSGVPFVYLWGRHPIMVYATPPVYGATNYRGPVWMGLPVQWCGGVYAYALTRLAPHDKTLDWAHLARGILVAAQQIQYPDGPLAGCLPDVFHLASQRRDGPSINPSALVSLQLALEGKVDGLAVAADGKRRVTAPFAVRLAGDKAHLQGTPGLTYQILVNGKVVEVRSQGQDVVELDP